MISQTVREDRPRPSDVGSRHPVSAPARERASLPVAVRWQMLQRFYDDVAELGSALLAEERTRAE